MMLSLPEYEVFAVRYAQLERLRRDNFMIPDPHDGPMPMENRSNTETAMTEGGRATAWG